MRPLHESVAEGKSDEIVEDEANNELISKFFNEKQWNFSHFTRHPIRAKVSLYPKAWWASFVWQFKSFRVINTYKI